MLKLVLCRHQRPGCRAARCAGHTLACQCRLCRGSRHTRRKRTPSRWWRRRTTTPTITTTIRPTTRRPGLRSPPAPWPLRPLSSSSKHPLRRRLLAAKPPIRTLVHTCWRSRRLRRRTRPPNRPLRPLRQQPPLQPPLQIKTSSSSSSNNSKNGTWQWTWPAALPVRLTTNRPCPALSPVSLRPATWKWWADSIRAAPPAATTTKSRAAAALPAASRDWCSPPPDSPPDLHFRPVP